MKLSKIFALTLLGVAILTPNVAEAKATKGAKASNDEEAQARISWDASSLKVIETIKMDNVDSTEVNLCYPRIKRLSDGALLLTFMDSHYGFNIYSARSEDNGESWQNVNLIRHWYPARSTVGPDKKVFVNPDFIELQNGRIILAYQWRYKDGYGDIPNTNNNCGIEIIFSKDKGRTWGTPREVFRARCWEPAFLQLPSGEIQMYITSSQDVVNNTSYPRTIILRSFDGGETWQGKKCCGIDDVEPISRTIDERFAYDGMPSAVLLNDGEGIVCPLEVWSGKLAVDQTPIVIKTDMKTNWRFDHKKILEEGGPDFPDKKEVNKDFQGYGPYCSKLPEGEVLVLSNGSYKGEEGVWVFIGNKHADNFFYATKPLTGYWGAIDYIGGGKVIACASEKYEVDGKDRYRIKYITGYVNRTKEVEKGRLILPRITEFAAAEKADWWFLGGNEEKSKTFFNFAYTKDAFEIGAYIFDKNIVAYTPENSDAPEVQIARSTTAGWEKYQIITNANGKLIVYKEYTRSWHKVWEGTSQIEVVGVTNKTAGKDLGYSAIMSVPWNVIGGAPKKGEEIHAHIMRHIKTKVKEKPLSTLESQEGEDTDAPQYWNKLIIK